MKRNKIILGVTILFLLILQLFRMAPGNPQSKEEMDLLHMKSMPVEVSTLIKNSCYDCHSNETNYPWYSAIAPISWITGQHIKEGREHLNFSEWGGYSAKKQISLAEECAEEVGEGEMPLKTYTLMHKDARLSTEDKALLTNWFEHTMLLQSGLSAE